MMKKLIKLLIVSMILTSCFASKFEGDIEYKIVTWSDSETVAWRSLDSSRVGSLKNIDHECYFVGDTLEIIPFYK